MNDGLTHEHESHDPSAELDLLLARAVAGDRAALDAVRGRAAHDPSVLDELAMWQADELRLARIARELDAVADGVSIPRASRRWSGLGWAAAAIIAIAWGMRALAPQGAAPQANLAGVGAIGSADDAFDAYVAKAREEGLVTGDIAPPTLLRSRELGDGSGFEVLIIRQVIERRISPEIYRIAPTGEAGMRRTIVIRPRTDAVQ